MHFSSFADFVAMSGHGPYVWSSYALMLLMVAWNLLSVRQQRQRIRRKLSNRMAMYPETRFTKSATGVESSQ